MTVRFFRNPRPGPRWKLAHLPVRQTLIWVGPCFILVQRKNPR